MNTQNKHNEKTNDIDPVSRKTSEEIDEDESGNLIIGGEISLDNLPDKALNEYEPKRKNNLSDKDEARED